MDTTCRNCHRRIVRANPAARFWTAPDASPSARNVCSRTMAAHRPA